MTETPSSPQTPPVPERRGSRGGYWAVAMGLLIIACLVLPILLIRSAMTRVRSLGGTAESALISVRNAAEAFATRSVETTLRSYATSVKSMSKFQFAELKQLESFERTEGAALAWGTIPLPDVVVEARGRVVYAYLFDFPEEMGHEARERPRQRDSPRPRVRCACPRPLHPDLRRSSAARSFATKPRCGMRCRRACRCCWISAPGTTCPSSARNRAQGHRGVRAELSHREL